jgi:translocation protein SEC72
MSHGHTHGPDTPANHTHGPAQQIPQQRPAPDPILQAAIEADFKPVALVLGDAEKPRSIALCREHKKESCSQCGLEFVAMNAMAKMFSMAPMDAILPPPNVVPAGRAQAVSKTKDEGNVCIPHDTQFWNTEFVM